jgi:hypothetical protein
MPKALRRKSTRRPHAGQAGAPESAGAAFAALANDAVERGDPDAVSDQTLHAVLAAAVRIYAAKAERRSGDVRPFADGAITATEAVVAACGLMRAADLSPFDLAMWFHRLAAR